jgi:hypothetical protein
MAIAALIEDPRTTLYRQRLAALLRRPSCQWIAFSIGTAPIHRDFVHDAAAAIEGLPTGGFEQRDGVKHRRVQLGVRLRVGAAPAGQATYHPEQMVLAVAEEADLENLDGQAALVGACVHLGLHLQRRTLQPLDCECAARVAGHLYRLFESIGDDESEQVIADKMDKLEPETEKDRAFYRIARDVFSHRRATRLANMRARHRLEPGSFMKIVPAAERDQLHALLIQGQGRKVQPPRPLPAAADVRSMRYLALQAVPAMDAPSLRPATPVRAPVLPLGRKRGLTPAA